MERKQLEARQIKQLSIWLIKLKSCNIKFKHGNMPDSKFDKKWLTIGMKVESEHTNNKSLQKQIAKAHLVEAKNYYKLLEQMEKKFKKR